MAAAAASASASAPSRDQAASEHDAVVILDFGSQFSHLIARRVRELNVYCELQACTIDPSYLRSFGPRLKGVILSGGPHSVYDEGSPHVSKDTWEYILNDAKLPLLGVCYGLQEIAHRMGGRVVPSSKREYGLAHIKNAANKRSIIFEGCPEEGSKVWMSHGDKVESLPEGFISIASSENSPFAAVACESKDVYGLQFHPEVTHSEYGIQMIGNFVKNVCKCSAKWRMDDILEQMTARIKEQVGEESIVIGGVSGGVDSTVAAVLMTRAIGKRFHAIMVDNGLLRKGEADEVVERLNKKCGVNLRCVDASELFLQRLQNVSDPETKRKVIGNTFIEVFEKEAAAIAKTAGREPEFLLQGTLYPDVIESVSYKGPSATIKTHHNVGGLPEHMKMKLVEPLRLLFKDEVRHLGMAMGIDKPSVFRHPFPGPGLGIRILGPISKEGLHKLREADAIYLEEIRRAGLYDDIGQAFAVLLPCKSVGVMGDGRTYEQVVALRAVQTTDFMTADWFHMPYDVLHTISTRIINEVHGVNRVCYDVSSKPPSTIEWE